MAAASPSQLDTLTRLNTDDIFESTGLAQLQLGRRLLAALFWPAARRFARQMTAYDAVVGDHGLPTGAEWLLRQFIRELRVAGQQAVPASGPVLIVSNHPGMVDTVALFLSVGRPDLHIVALARPFLQALPNTSRRLIYVTEDAHARLPAVRAVVARLRAGGAVLTFPAGEIEPDPAVLPGAAQALDSWSDSVSLFARLAPELVVVPAIVSGVLSAGAQRNPLTRLRRTRVNRERMAAMLQVMLPWYQSVTVRVAFGPALHVKDFKAAPAEPGGLQRAVVAEARRLIEQPPEDWRTVMRGVR